MAITDEGILLPNQNENCENFEEQKPCCEHGPQPCCEHGPHHIKPPFHKPKFTIQEQFIETTRRVNETLERVLKMEKRILCDLQKFTDCITADNVAFKDLMVDTYNSFAKVVKNEVNSFEAEITNAYNALNESIKTDLGDFENRYDDFEAEIDQKISDFETSSTAAIVELENRLMNTYSEFAESINSTLVDYENNYHQEVEAQNAVIESALKDFNENLTARVETVLNTIVATGGLDDAIMEAIQGDYMRVIDTTVNMLQTDLKVGEHVRTLGFYNAYDGGGAIFTIGSETTKFKLANGNGALINHNIYEDVNVKQYGAYGDWQSHKASAEYETLAELQAVFPYATSLDEEIDTIVIKMLLLYSSGNIYLPKGGYMISGGLEVSRARTIYGDGETVSALNCAYEDKQYNTTPLITITSDNVVVKDLTIHYPESYTNGVAGNNLAKMTAILADETTNGLYQNLTIVGFENGLHFGNNSWCNNIENCNIRYCASGIYGAAEFNNINIINTVITYCLTAINIRGGRSININGCSMENCELGIYRLGKGDTNVKNCFFEANIQYSIGLHYGNTAGDIMNIEGCSFHATRPESFIVINGDNTTVVRVLGCHFNSNSLDDGIASCMSLYNDTNNPVIVFENNYVSTAVQLGVKKNRISGYFENAKRMEYVGTSIAAPNRIFLLGAMFGECESPYTIFYPDYPIKLFDFSTKNMTGDRFYRFAFLRDNAGIISPTTFEDTTVEGYTVYLRGVTEIYPNKIYAIRQSTISVDDGNTVIEYHVMEG